MAAYVVEKTLQVTITDEDLNEGDEELTAELAIAISYEIDTSEWQEIDRWAEDYS